MNKEEAYEIFKKYEEVIVNYSPFEDLEDDSIVDVPAEMIWSYLEWGDGLHLVNGYSESFDVAYYSKSVIQWDTEAFSIDVIETLYFECIDCNGSSKCKFCDKETNMSQIDFVSFLKKTKEPDRNPDTLWKCREPY